MSIQVTFPGGLRVDAHVGSHVVHTDQSQANGGGGTAPEPYQLFLASLATCAGIYVLGFCRSRGIATDGIQVVQRQHFDPVTHLPSRVEIDVVLPPGFPERYRAAVVQAAQGCKVKKTLMSPPELVVSAVDAAGYAA
jgi:ribosomal protein S12 methylthiotransferase accessory factor